MAEIKLTLTLEEAQIIFNLIGQTPTSGGLFPLLMKVKGQVEQQANPAGDKD